MSPRVAAYSKSIARTNRPWSIDQSPLAVFEAAVMSIGNVEFPILPRHGEVLPDGPDDAEELVNGDPTARRGDCAGPR